MLDLLWPIAGGFIRHLINSFAVYLVTVGVLSSAQANQFAGALLIIVSIVWSAWHKINTPEGLARLVERMKDKNVKQAWADQVLKGSGLAIAVLAPFVGLVMLASSAGAQTVVVKRHGQMKHITIVPESEQRMNAGLAGLIQQATGQPVVDPLDALFRHIQQASITDLQYAKALADQAAPASPSAAVRSKCYGAFLSVLATTSSVQASVAAGPAQPSGLAVAFTRFEQLSQTADALAPMSTFQQACAPVAQALRMNMGQFVLGVLGGGLGLAKLGILP